MTASSGEQIVRANGVDLRVQTFGNPADPPILLIHGAAASMIWWEDEFCERRAAGPRFVIRYDHRDTGRSVCYEPGSPPSDHGAALQQEIPDARLLMLDRMGHELPRAVWDVAIPAIVQHTAA